MTTITLTKPQQSVLEIYVLDCAHAEDKDSDFLALRNAVLGTRLKFGDDAEAIKRAINDQSNACDEIGELKDSQIFTNLLLKIMRTFS